MLCEVPAILHVYKVECSFSDAAAFHYFANLKIISPSVFLLSVSLTENKKQRTLGNQMENEAQDLDRTDHNQKCYSISGRAAEQMMYVDSLCVKSNMVLII
jgi:hypothetical protein